MKTFFGIAAFVVPMSAVIGVFASLPAAQAQTHPIN